MMRRLMWIGMAILAFHVWVWADCTGGFETTYKEKTIGLSIPGAIIKKATEKVPFVGELVGKVAPLFKVEITFTQSWSVAEAVCRCKPCCKAPQMQYLGVHFSLTAQIYGGTVHWSDILSETQQGKEPPVDLGITCSLRSSAQFSANTTVYGFGLDLPIDFEQAEAIVHVSASVDCKCTENPECEGNAPPEVLPFGPIELEYGKEADFVVVAIEKSGRPNLKEIGPAEAKGCLTAEKTKEGEVHDDSGWARFRLSYSGEEELIRSCTDIVAEDKCGSLRGYTAEVLIFYPPVLRLVESGWDGKSYWALVEVYDPNFKGCPKLWDPLTWETVTARVSDFSGVSDYFPPDRVISCYNHFNGRGFYPIGNIVPVPNRCPRWLEIVAEDWRGLTAVPLRIMVNRAPTVEVNPKELKVEPGKTFYASVAATDPDGDTVTLTMTSGPGSFSPVSGVGMASREWSWTVPKHIRFPSYRSYSYSAYVSFVAKDVGKDENDNEKPCGGVGYGFLHVRTVNPPEVSDAFALVPRGGKGHGHAYVYDPDSVYDFNSPHVPVSLGPVPPGLSVTARMEDDPFAPGMGGFMVVFGVSADSSLCDGEYAIPFTVTDPDGLSSSGTLFVRVVGNRPPVASHPGSAARPRSRSPRVVSSLALVWS